MTTSRHDTPTNLSRESVGKCALFSGEDRVGRRRNERAVITVVYSRERNNDKTCAARMEGYIVATIAPDSNLLLRNVGRLTIGVSNEEARVAVPRISRAITVTTPTSIRFPRCYRCRINVVFSFPGRPGSNVIDLTTGHFRPWLT